MPKATGLGGRQVHVDAFGYNVHGRQFGDDERGVRDGR